MLSLCPCTFHPRASHSPLWRVGDWNGFAARYGKTMEYLKGATESMTPDTVPWWLGMNSTSGLGKMWENLFKVIPRPSVSHFHLYCGTCALVGNSKTLWGSGLSHNINQCTAAFGMNQGHAQGFETAANQTTGHFVYPGNASNWGSWRQLVLLVLKLSGLVWTSDALSEEILEGGPVP
uniref:beta-D-galactosyl-(1->3)-N-acetyl-beta-D-galactosaminide alpha-2,3-sialyltransferase n=1 Tax=Ailuropoda melanoleuca TaxID=9646 RepID=G1LTF2_AILME